MDPSDFPFHIETYRKQSEFEEREIYHQPVYETSKNITGFKEMSRGTRPSTYERLCKLEAAPKTPGFREMKEDDCWSVHYLLIHRFKDSDVIVDACFDGKNIGELFLPREGVIYSYVVENPSTTLITDFCSFFTTCVTLLDNKGEKTTVHNAYSYYNAATGTNFTQLMNDLLITAKNKGMDCFFILDVKQPKQHNENYLEDLKFSEGVNGTRNYIYLHDLTSVKDECPIDPSKIGLVVW